ncbi:hypothetical protein JRO89_XS01G0304400 [Xanthoceras sorbifolium]|uniref:EF-hand domain-containing protein n=1 Tax=Xanthoceras sorbifolium TaxID=99658 RepID=A0ABQ8IMT7_9ROSI|nr:hypothetical protein JRO89_XS01G0304400 [Xanthoceras sorbifolium]
MADDDLSSPLLQSPRADQSHIIIAVQDDDSDSDPSYQDQPTRNQNHHRHSHNHNNHKDGRVRLSASSRNPYEFVGSDGLSVPGTTTADPFRNDTRKTIGVYEIVKIVVCVPIALARLVLFGLCLVVGFIATKLALQGWKDKQNPMPKWRCRIMWITRFSARCILFSFGYHWIRRKGKPAPREIAPIVVSNHISYIEPIFYFYELFPTIVASESHDSLPFVGTIIRAMQVIYVNRFSQSSRKNAVNEIKEFLQGDISLAMLMFRMFTQFHNFMEVEYLPVVFPNNNKKENALHFAEKTSHAIASALNVVQTSHSYGDVMLYMRASQLKQEKASIYMVEMARVESVSPYDEMPLFHISSLEAVGFLDKFLSMNPNSSGCVKLLEFLRVLRLKPCTLSEEIFGFIDVDKNGSITFKQFLFASAHVMKLPLFRQACELAFAECDTGGNGCISEHELGVAIRQAIPELNEDEIHGLFNLFDNDGDGRVSREDFLSCLRRNPLLVALFSTSLKHKDLSDAGKRTLEEIV